MGQKSLSKTCLSIILISRAYPFIWMLFFLQIQLIRTEEDKVEIICLYAYKKN